MTNDNDNDTTTTATHESMETDSFEHVRGGNPLSMTAFPRFDAIGLNATHKDTNPSTFTEGTKTMTSTEFCVTLQAGDLPDSEESRAPVDIVVALDTSGSMSERGKIDLCKKTLGLLLRQLSPRDRFGLISYENYSRVAVPLRRMTPEHKTVATNAIASLGAGGGTNISCAVGLSAQEMRTIDDPSPVQTVFFLTDGLANSGICNARELANLVKNCFTDGLIPDPQVFNTSMPPVRNRNRRGLGSRLWQKESLKKEPQPSATEKAETKKLPAISLHTFGYGADHNAMLLKEMASATEGGSYYFIEEDKDVGSAFGDALGGVLSVVAQNAMVTLEVPAVAKAKGVVIEKVHHDQAIQRENGSYTVNMGGFYAEETRDLVLTVTLANPLEPAAEPIPHVTASLSYTDIVAARLVRGDTVVVSVARPAGEHLSEENPHVAAQVFRVSASKAMEEAEQLASTGQYREAKVKFMTMKADFLRCSPAVQSTAQAEELFRDADEMESAMDDLTVTGYSSAGLAKLSTKSRAHKTQRAAVSSAASLSPKAYKQSKQRSAYSSKCALN